MMDNNIGKFIASLRKEKNLTQQALGEMLFVTDKAVSKWERGLSLPDVTLLNKLAEILEVDVTEILEGKKGTKVKVDIEKRIEELKVELGNKHKKKIRRILSFLILLICFILYLLFRNIYFGYEMETVYYSHSDREIDIGVPKTSFMTKNNDRSFSFKNLRSSNIIENEVKKYLKTLEYSTCNDTIYYYDNEDNFSIIDYGIKSHILFSTISYEVVEGNYCFSEKINDYSQKLNGLKRYHTFNGEGFSLSENKKFTPRLVIAFIDSIDSESLEFTATLEARYLYPIPGEWKVIGRKELENSKGFYEIKKDRLYYYRTDTSFVSEDIKIPEVTVFKIDNGNLILEDDYLDNYEKDIVLR